MVLLFWNWFWLLLHCWKSERDFDFIFFKGWMTLSIEKFYFTSPNIRFSKAIIQVLSDISHCHHYRDNRYCHNNHNHIYFYHHHHHRGEDINCRPGQNRRLAFKQKRSLVREASRKSASIVFSLWLSNRGVNVLWEDTAPPLHHDEQHNISKYP